MTIKFKHKELHINGYIIHFQFNILELKELKSGEVFGLLKIPMDSKALDNLYLFSEKGKLILRIQKPEKALIGNLQYPYVGLSLTENSYSVVDFYGRRFSFKISNGEITGMDIVR